MRSPCDRIKVFLSHQLMTPCVLEPVGVSLRRGSRPRLTPTSWRLNEERDSVCIPSTGIERCIGH